MLVVSEPHLRMKPSSLFAFAHCSKTCLDQVRSLVTHVPRSFSSDVTVSICLD